ncbi:MAG TPA: hypothetical protein VLA82_04350 [Actinomycetota bacterium]|nr:hypothetical protein [Actinomycetota bacterium]
MRPIWNDQEFRHRERELREAAERRRLETTRRDTMVDERTSSPRRPASR